MTDEFVTEMSSKDSLARAQPRRANAVRGPRQQGASDTAASVCDVLIVGGGLVGASLAIALDDCGFAVTLAEAVPPRVDAEPSYDERNLALAGASVNALRALDVIGDAAPLTPIDRIHVSRRGDFGAARLAASELGLPAFGAVLPARALGNALQARLQRCVNLERIAPAVATAIADDGDRLAVELRCGDGARTIDTRLLVGADGTESFVRGALGIGAVRHDYAQCAFVTTLTCEKPLGGTAYERFTDSGPVALLPLGERRAGLVLTVPAADAERVAALDDAAFVAFVHERFGWRAGRFSRPGRRKPYPLARVVAERTTAARCVLVGNAAQTVHPIGAQGFNLGLRDALILAEVVRAAANDRSDPGAPGSLAAFVARRADDRAATTAFSDDLVHAMGSELLPARLLRSLGLHALDRIAPLKQRFALRAMGFRGDVPALSLRR